MRKRISVEELSDRFDEIIDEVINTKEEIEVVKVVCIIKPVLDQEGWGNDEHTEQSQYRSGSTKPVKGNRNKR
jgi:hypothetical protein